MAEEIRLLRDVDGVILIQRHDGVHVGVGIRGGLRGGQHGRQVVLVVVLSQPHVQAGHDALHSHGGHGGIRLAVGVIDLEHGVVRIHVAGPGVEVVKHSAGHHEAAVEACRQGGGFGVAFGGACVIFGGRVRLRHRIALDDAIRLIVAFAFISVPLGCVHMADGVDVKSGFAQEAADGGCGGVPRLAGGVQCGSVDGHVDMISFPLDAFRQALKDGCAVAVDRVSLALGDGNLVGRIINGADGHRFGEHPRRVRGRCVLSFCGFIRVLEGIYIDAIDLSFVIGGRDGGVAFECAGACVGSFRDRECHGHVGIIGVVFREAPIVGIGDDVIVGAGHEDCRRKDHGHECPKLRFHSSKILKMFENL